MSQKPRTGGPYREMPAVIPAAVKAGPVETANPVVPVSPVEMATPAVPASPIETANPVVPASPVETGRPDAQAGTEPVFDATPVRTPEPVPPTELMTDAPKPAVASIAAETAAATPTRPTLTQGMQTMMKTTEDFVAFSQANLEAFVKSGQIWSAGMQELTKQMASSAKASFEESVSTFRALSGVRSVKEVMDLQSSFAKAAIEKAMVESNKLTDASIKLTEEALAPITARMTVAVETFKTH